jgi:hypothetical protein
MVSKYDSITSNNGTREVAVIFPRPPESVSSTVCLCSSFSSVLLLYDTSTIKSRPKHSTSLEHIQR